MDREQMNQNTSGGGKFSFTNIENYIQIVFIDSENYL